MRNLLFWLMVAVVSAIGWLTFAQEESVEEAPPPTAVEPAAAQTSPVPATTPGADSAAVARYGPPSSRGSPAPAVEDPTARKDEENLFY